MAARRKAVDCAHECAEAQAEEVARPPGRDFALLESSGDGDTGRVSSDRITSGSAFSGVGTRAAAFGRGLPARDPAAVAVVRQACAVQPLSANADDHDYRTGARDLLRTVSQSGDRGAF